MTAEEIKPFEFEKGLEDPRRTELEEKEKKKTITPEEQAELFGLRLFPDDPRGADLRKKEALETITPEEQEELRRLYQLKTRKKKFTPEVQELWEKVEQGDPNVIRVDMNQGQSCEIEPHDTAEKVIWTSALGGCFGTLVFIESKAGKRSAILTHYDPLHIQVNALKLKQLITPEMQDAPIKQTIVVMAAGEYIQDLKTGELKMTVKDQKKTDLLISTVRETLGENIEVTLEPYSEKLVKGRKDQGVMIVRVPPKTQATYRTWFSSGILGKGEEKK
ncbi:hypothetical protein MYX07_01825 [Patescibacteria group bacterium AH-259-L07]|nr:hypothetical protein [Patescibacteria group bacterium AH-259-L07]